MWLIAIDEAGYGPTLGPLVIAATAWRGEPSVERDSGALVNPKRGATAEPFEGGGLTEGALDVSFAPLTRPVRVGGLTIRVDDSKRVFKSTPAQTACDPLAGLRSIFAVAHHACGRGEFSLAERLATLVPDDHETIAATPWLAGMLSPDAPPDPLLVDVERSAEAVRQWQSGPWRLVDVRARMITAMQFNRFCESQPDAGNHAVVGGNKSDLLSQTSLRLAHDLLAAVTADSHDREPVLIFFDRHGGRRYYAGVVQQVFDESPVRVISETGTRSVYESVWNHRRLRLQFTVKGDSFAPVSLSSLHAKYLRESAMSSLNRFFTDRLDQLRPADARDLAKRGDRKLKPTAGYPTDAKRFLEEISPVIHADAIDLFRLVRRR